MNKITVYATALVLSAACSTPGSESTENTSEIEQKPSMSDPIERLDVELDNFFDQEAKLETLSSGFTWSEGPVWVEDLNAVVFSDVPNNIAYKWSETDSLTTYLQPSGYTGQAKGKEGANGLIIDKLGRLVLCQHGNRQLARMNAPLSNPDENYEVIADSYNGKRFNSPNDVVQNSRGTFFFTDPPYGLKDDDHQELDFQGVYKVDEKGTVSLLVDSLSFPNGIGLSPDEKTLYVAVSDPKRARYYAFDLNESDDITGGRVLLDVTSLSGKDRPGSPDGLCVHKSGNLFATGPGGVLIITPEGKHLGTVLTGHATANCTFNQDQTALYMTAHKHLMRISLKESR